MDKKSQTTKYALWPAMLSCLLMQGCTEQASSPTQMPQQVTVRQVSSAVPKPAPTKYTSGPPPPGWLKKLDPATATAEAKLNKKYTIRERMSLFHKLQVRQDMTRSAIHFKFMQMPPASSEQEKDDLYREEGDEELAAQNKVEADFRHEERLTTEEMDQFFQEANENNWQ